MNKNQNGMLFKQVVLIVVYTTVNTYFYKKRDWFVLVTLF